MKTEKSEKGFFNLADAIERYSLHITNDIRSHKTQREVAQEYAAHLEDAVYERMLSGASEQDAFTAACEALGNPTELQEVLACIHNRDPLPSYVRVLLLLLAACFPIALYFLIENTIFRAWMVLFFQLILLGFGIYGIICLSRLIRTLRRRYSTLKKLKLYAKENGLIYTCHGNGYAGVFRPTKTAEITIDTPDSRYILTLWGTFHGKRHLHLTDIGLYMYTRVIGYANIWTRAYNFFPGAHAALALPKGLTYFSTLHTELTDVPKGTHLLPKVNFEAQELPQKKNVRILLLSPVPFKTSALISGREKEILDGDTFDGATVYSTVGFLSYLNGERIATNGTFRRK